MLSSGPPKTIIACRLTDQSLTDTPWLSVADHWGPILKNHGIPLSLQISFFLYRKWHAIIFKNRAPGSVSLLRQEIVPMLSTALKSIYGSAVYLFGNTAFPDLWLQARCRRSALLTASRANSPAFFGHCDQMWYLGYYNKKNVLRNRNWTSYEHQ
jgi:hypothetical protein